MALAKFRFSNSPGFSLIETMVATTILAVALTALAQLFTISISNNLVAKNGTFTAVLAAQKLEQLRGLTWGYNTLGLPISDVSTDTSVSPEAATGGTGLAPSPENTLQGNVDGYVDYLDGNGVALGGGTVIPDNASYIRRWLIEPLPTNPNNTLIIQVLVTRRRDRGTADAGSVARAPEEARLLTVKTRKAL
jgi:prepilin-type N-terminal cleavage/methylation domain-containing protein